MDMTKITHHLPDALLAAYAAGNLPYAYSLVVASHVSMCDECRASMEAHQAIGGEMLEQTSSVSLSEDLKSSIFSHLDDVCPPEEPVYTRSGIYPGPVMEALKGRSVWS